MTFAARTALYRLLRRLARAAGKAGVGTERIPASWRARVRGTLVPGDGEDRLRVHTHGLILEMPHRYAAHYVDREYEPLTTQRLMAVVTAGCTVVDIGAHIGYYTCLAARQVGPHGLVHAVEPAPANLGLLRQNVALNGLANVTIHPVAAARVGGMRRLNLSEASDSNSLYRDVPGGGDRMEAGHHSIDVPAVAIADVVAGPVSVIKMDVEGAELEALEGLAALLARSVGATVIVEWNPERLSAAGEDPTTLPNLLDDLGVRNLEVLDDFARRVRSLAEAREALDDGALRPSWYANIVGTVERRGHPR